MSLLTTKDLAREMGLHPRTVKRWWKRLKVKPDACAGNSCHRWTPKAYARLLKRWRAYWAIRKGRGLTYLVSGSVALPNSARCVYVLLPWSDDTEDNRIYWVCPKLNNGEMYAPSVWIRKLGTFFEHDTKTDPKSWGKEEEDYDARAISAEDVREAFGSESFLTKAALTKRLMKATKCGEKTAYRAIGRGGYLWELFEVSEEGWLKLKEAKS